MAEMVYRFNDPMTYAPRPPPHRKVDIVDYLRAARGDARADDAQMLARERAEEQARQFGISTDIDRARLLARAKEAKLAAKGNTLREMAGKRAQASQGLDFLGKAQGYRDQLDPDMAGAVTEIGEGFYPGFAGLLPPHQRAKHIEAQGPPAGPALAGPAARPGATRPNDYDVPPGDQLGVTNQRKRDIPLASDAPPAGEVPMPEPQAPPMPDAGIVPEGTAQRPEGPPGLGQPTERFSNMLTSLSDELGQRAQAAQAAGDRFGAAAAAMVQPRLMSILRSTGDLGKAREQASEEVESLAKRLSQAENAKTMAGQRQQRLDRPNANTFDRGMERIAKTAKRSGGEDALNAYTGINSVTSAIEAHPDDPRLIASALYQAAGALSGQTGHGLSDKDANRIFGESLAAMSEGTIATKLMGEAGARRLADLKQTLAGAKVKAFADAKRSYETSKKLIESSSRMRGTELYDGMEAGMAIYDPIVEQIEREKQARQAAGLVTPDTF